MLLCGNCCEGIVNEQPMASERGERANAHSLGLRILCVCVTPTVLVCLLTLAMLLLFTTFASSPRGEFLQKKSSGPLSPGVGIGGAFSVLVILAGIPFFTALSTLVLANREWGKLWNGVCVGTGVGVGISFTLNLLLYWLI